jgi:Ca2+-binding EF-hand superfamily protein
MVTGQISKDEFRQALHQVSNDFDTVIEPLHRACFRLADRDDDGLVSKQELIAAEVAVGVPAYDADATFDRLTEQASD